MVRRRDDGVVASIALLVFAAACTASHASHLRPGAPTAKEVYEPSWQCTKVAGYGEPLVVDLRAHERANIEEAMRDGVAVVAYDCSGRRVLPGCRVEGSYGFISVSRKEDIVQLTDATQLRANLPAGGLVDMLSADVASGSSIDIAMILVGKRRTTVSHVSSASLNEDPACSGATHFVRGAHIGAFAVDTGTQGHARAAASVFAEASARSTKVTQFRDGQSETCQQLTTDEPRATCNAILRLELYGIDQLESGAVSARAPCPVGLQLMAGKCARPEAEEAHLCNFGDVDDCTKQCAKSDAGSCYALGRAYFFATNVSKDLIEAQRFLAQGCDAGSSACATRTTNV